MRGSSWARWTSRTSTSSRACRRRSRSTRSRPRRNPRSTVGTITEVYDYLRLLYARIGKPHCPVCGEPIAKQTPQQIVDRILEMPEGTRFQVLAPVIRERKGEYVDLFADLQTKGFARVRVDGVVHSLTEPPKLKKQEKHTIEAVVDRLAVKPSSKQRITDSVETALGLAGGLVILDFVDLPEDDPHRERRYSERLACPNDHPLAIDELEPRSFSFNSPFGACPVCTGLGTRKEVDPELVVPDPELSLRGRCDHAVVHWPDERVLPASAAGRRRCRGLPSRHAVAQAHRACAEGGALRPGRAGARQLSEPVRAQPQLLRHLRGRGAVDRAPLHRNRLRLLAREVRGLHARGAVPDLRRHSPQARDPRCYSSRVVRSPNLRHSRLERPPQWLRALELDDRDSFIGERVLKEIHARLGFLVDVGLHYLSLDRAAATLAGGEAQRIRLATQIGSGLVGVLYVLDEPSIGLHQRDNHRLIETLVRLKSPGQHADRRRARRGHDPHRRLGGRHRPAGRRARRLDRGQRHGRRPAALARLDHRRISRPGAARSMCR